MFATMESHSSILLLLFLALWFGGMIDETIGRKKIREGPVHKAFRKIRHRGGPMRERKKKKIPGYCVPPRAQKCPVSIPNPYESGICKSQRINDVSKSRKFYHLTTLGGTKRIKFPLDAIPFINQTLEAVTLQASLEETDSRWLAPFIVIKTSIETFQKKLMEMFVGKEFKKPDSYINIYSAHKLLIQHFGAGDSFTNPTFSPSFTDVIYNGRFLTDDVFVQTRLAGPCPFLIKLVTQIGEVGLHWTKLKERLNPEFDFDTPLQKAISEERMTMSKAVEEKMLYVLYSEEMRGIPTMPDYYGQPLLNITSPIAIFARTRSGELKIVAIQMEDVSTSDVHTPYSSPLDWATAKNLVNTADNNICQAVWHFSHIHLSGSTFCTLFRSHFSSLHPIHQIFKFHCEGTTPHIGLSYRSLLTEDSFANRLISISDEGYKSLSMKGFKKFNYELLDLEHILRMNGLDSPRLKYHPFRDDGRLIWSTFKSFSRQFTNIYYKNDWDVLEDKELQSFAAQVSINGQGASYGGKSNIVGFPSSFETKAQVETFLTRFLWQIALHAVENYPLEPYGSFVPLSPTKLYPGSEHGNVFDTLPGLGEAIGAALFGTIAGNTRINRIFDYYDKLKDQRLEGLVRKFHHRMHSCVQETLEKRNEKRKEKNLLSFQYLEPKWLTNSIHI